MQTEKRIEREWHIELCAARDKKQVFLRENVMELHIVLCGEALYQCSERRFAARSGDIILIRPYDTQYMIFTGQDSSFKWMRLLFSPELLRNLPEGGVLLSSFYAAHQTARLPADSNLVRQAFQAACRALQEQQKELQNGLKQYVHVVDVLANLYSFFVSERKEIAEQVETDTFYVDSGMTDAIAYIVEHVNQDIDMNELIRAVGKGKTQFYSDFRKVVGLTPNRFVHRLRMQMATRLLKATDLSITAIAFECGYHSIHYFNKHFKQHCQLSPREYRNVERRAIV